MLELVTLPALSCNDLGFGVKGLSFRGCGVESVSLKPRVAMMQTAQRSPSPGWRGSSPVMLPGAAMGVWRSTRAGAWFDHWYNSGCAHRRSDEREGERGKGGRSPLEAAAGELHHGVGCLEPQTEENAPGWHAQRKLQPQQRCRRRMRQHDHVWALLPVG